MYKVSLISLLLKKNFKDFIKKLIKIASRVLQQLRVLLFGFFFLLKKIPTMIIQLAMIRRAQIINKHRMIRSKTRDTQRTPKKKNSYVENEIFEKFWCHARG